MNNNQYLHHYKSKHKQIKTQIKDIIFLLIFFQNLTTYMYRLHTLLQRGCTLGNKLDNVTVCRKWQHIITYNPWYNVTTFIYNWSQLCSKQEILISHQINGCLIIWTNIVWTTYISKHIHTFKTASSAFSL